jgi:hypothetical protein
MPERAYTLRRTWPDDSDRPDDFVFRCDCVDAGRCYLMLAVGSREVWNWTAYGISSGGMEDSLDKAKYGFKIAFERAGGLAASPRRQRKKNPAAR